MKNKYLSLLFASFFVISGCETIAAHHHQILHHMSMGTQTSESSRIFTNEIGDRIYFETDKHNINSASAFTLESQANWLKSTPGFQIIIEGHCDERGTREYNLALGERRVTLKNS